MRFKHALLGIAIGVLWTGSVFAATDPVNSWNSIVSQAALAAGQSPPVVARTLAIAQLAIHDALNAINSRYEPYAFRGTAPAGASLDDPLSLLISQKHSVVVHSFVSRDLDGAHGYRK